MRLKNFNSRSVHGDPTLVLSVLVMNKVWHGSSGTERLRALDRILPRNTLTERLEEGAILELAGNINGERFLDLGCGDGAYSIAAFQRGARVTGVDISDAMLDSARRRAAA